jgi:hypothetical protein
MCSNHNNRDGATLTYIRTLFGKTKRALSCLLESNALKILFKSVYNNAKKFYGIEPRTSRLPGVYTSVPKFVDWIRETMEKNEN